MKNIRYGLIIVAVIILVVLIWFLIPEPPSSLKGNLYEDSYIAGTVRVSSLWKRPFTAILSSIPNSRSSLQEIPFFLRPFIPPTAELYILKNKEEGGGWTAAIDLGWRSKFFRRIHSIIMEQVQYRGFGAIEGKYIIRTPSGSGMLVYQDKGTLFIGEGDSLIKKILTPLQGKDINQNLKSTEGLRSQISDGKDIAYILFLNNGMEFSKVIEGIEKENGFSLLPSVNSLRGGTLKIRHPGNDTIVAELSLMIQDNGDISGVENDLGYLLDLFDRLLSTSNLKIDRTINKENGNITAQVMIHQVGGPKQ